MPSQSAPSNAPERPINQRDMKHALAVLVAAAVMVTAAPPAPAQQRRPQPGAPQASQATQASLVAYVRTIATRITSMLAVARRARDTARQTCLDEKLTRAHAALADARTARIPRIQSAIRSRARDIALQAEACGRPEGEVIGRPTRETIVDPSIPAEDPTLLDQETFVVERPPSASGYY